MVGFIVAVERSFAALQRSVTRQRGRLLHATGKLVEDDPYSWVCLQLPVSDEPDRELKGGQIRQDLLDPRFCVA